MKEIRTQAEKHPQLKEDISKSLRPVIEILNDLFSQLSLRGKRFQTFQPKVSDLQAVVICYLICRSLITQHEKEPTYWLHAKGAEN